MKKQLFLKQKDPFSKCSGFSWICLLVFLTLLVFGSCNKEDSIINYDNIINDDITFRDGRLIFKDVTTFMDHQKWIFENQGNPQLIADKNKSLGLKSMTEYYLEGMKLEENDPKFLEYVYNYPSVFYTEAYENSTLYLLPHSIILCYVANKDGIFQVGDKINRIVWKNIYEITDGDESKIDILFLPENKVSEKGIKIIPSVSDAKNDYAQRTRYFSNTKYRIVSSLREYVIYSVWYDEIQTNPQHKVLGIWGRAQLATKSAHGDGYVKALYGEQDGPIYASYSENTGLSFIVMYMGDLQIDMSESYCPAYSRGRLNTEYIYVYWPDALEVNPPYQEPNWTPGVDEPF